MSIVDSLLNDPARRRAVIADAVAVLNSEVESKSGLSGLAIKGGFKVVSGIAPGIIPNTVDALLDEFVRALEPQFLAWKAAGSPGTVADWFVRNAGTCADALLAITDGRARRSTHKTLVGAYNKLRPMAREHVMAAMPRVGGLIQKHVVG